MKSRVQAWDDAIVAAADAAAAVAAGDSQYCNRVMQGRLANQGLIKVCFIYLFPSLPTTTTYFVNP